jgi:hypothetical protein
MTEECTANSCSQLDSLILGGDSVSWMGKNTILPSSWALKEEEARRILAARIRFFIFFSPVFVLDLNPNPFGLVFTGHVICLNGDLLETNARQENKMTDLEQRIRILTREEMIAMFLHEIGHKVNYFRSKHPKGSAERLTEDKERGVTAVEHDADDYARHCGYENHLMSGLQKLIDSGLPGFDRPVNHDRVKRIKEGHGIHRHF